MIAQVRSAHPSISLGGQDYYGALSPYFVSMTYEDNCDGLKADDLHIVLADREHKFISTWAPAKGTTIEAGIIADRWFAPNAASLKLDCGTFWIDTVEFTLPDSKVLIKAASIPTDVRIKASTETRGWEKTTLQDVANQIAGENKMSLSWLAQLNPRYKRVEQVEESGLGFLQKKANDAKLAIKVHRSKIIVFDEQKLEEAAPAFTLVYGNLPMQGGNCYRLAGAHFVSKIMDTAQAAKVSYASAESGNVNSGEWATVTGDSGPDAEGGDTEGDKVNHDPDTEEAEEDGAMLRADDLSGSWETNDGPCELKAKSLLRDKNKKKDQCRLELGIGNPLVAAGQTLNLVGCGQFDGKWFIETAHHTLGPEYNTALIIRRCLSGY